MIVFKKNRIFETDGLNRPGKAHWGKGILIAKCGFGSCHGFTFWMERPTNGTWYNEYKIHGIYVKVKCYFSASLPFCRRFSIWAGKTVPGGIGDQSQRFVYGEFLNFIFHYCSSATTVILCPAEQPLRTSPRGAISFGSFSFSKKMNRRYQFFKNIFIQF